MGSSSLRAAFGLLLSHLSFTIAQSTPGAKLLQGGGSPGAAPYELVDEYTPDVFFSKFNYDDSYDKTYGHVQYVNESVAVQNGYTYWSKDRDSAVIKPDTVGIWPNGGKGRPSIRITSDNTYNHGLFVMDMAHMPAGCGTWPAYWLLGPDWPYTGEIDIIEGTNTAEINTVSLHSTSDCTIAGSDQTGTFETSICDVTQNGNSGCGSQLTNTTALPNNYGSSFNTNGGGVYATEWTSEYIKTWWFPRGSIPDSIRLGNPDVAEFGTPAVNAQGDCDIDARFQNMSVIINIDFCGAWAGNVYYNSYPNCPQSANAANDPIGSCVDYVGNNPDKLGEAYFEIYSLKVYQMPTDVAPTSSYSMSLSSVTPVATTNTVPIGMGGTASSFPATPTFTGSVAGPAATNPPSVCPQYDQSLIVNSNGQQDLIYCGFDWSGGTLGVRSEIKSFDACMVICDNTAGCEAVTFTGGNGEGACYLKPAGATLIAVQGIDAAKRVDGPSSGPSSTTSASSRAVTSSTTSSFSRSLVSFTTSGSDTPVASSSRSQLMASTTAGAPSGRATVAASVAACPANDLDHVLDNCGVEYIMNCGTDTSTGSFTGVQVKAFSDCFEICSSGSRGTCSAFSYNTDSKYCYLKHGTGEHFQDKIALVIGVIQVDYLGSPNAPTNSVSRACNPSTVVFPSSTMSALVSSTASSSFTKSSSSAGSSSYFQPTSNTETSAVSSSGTVAQSSAAGTGSSFVMSPSSFVASSSLGQSSSEIVPSSMSSFNASESSSVNPSKPISTVSSLAPSESSSAALATTSALVPETITSAIGSISVTFCPDCVASIVSSTTSSATASGTAIAACPTQTSAICGSDEAIQTPTTCSSPGEAIYVVTCGILYAGTEIPDNLASRSKNATRLASRSSLSKRFSSPDLGSCQSACDNTAGCIALNYNVTECTLLSTTTATFLQPGAVSASKVGVSMEGDDEPTCPGSTGMAYISSSGTNYTISCSYFYEGDNIAVLGADSFSDCLPSCDLASNCVGIQYDNRNGICYLKSSFGRPSYDSDGDFLVGMKVADSPPVYSTTSSSLSSAEATSSSAAQQTITTTAATRTVQPDATITTFGNFSGIFTATTIIISTLPPGASLTTVLNGSSSNSFYVFTTTSAPTSDGVSIPTGSCTEDLCFDCGLIPIVTTKCGEATTRLPPPTDVPSSTNANSTGLITTVSPSATSASVCPTQTSSLCASSSKKLSCDSLSGKPYDLTCGVIVLGLEVLDELVNLLDKRVVVPDFDTCLSTCDKTAGCIAVNYIGSQCRLFSSISGTAVLPGAVSAVQQGANSGGGGLTTSTITSYVNGVCPSLTAGGTRTRTVYNTLTITSCAAQLICPNPGYVIIGGSATIPGGVVVTTKNGNGTPVTYTQIQTSDIPITTTDSNGASVVATQTAPPMYSGGSASGGSGSASGTGTFGTGPDTGPGIGYNTVTETTTNSDGVTIRITQIPSPTGLAPGGPVPDCAKNCLAAPDLRGCGPTDVSCICRNQELIAAYSCCLSQSCGTSFELSAIMIVGRLLCACYGFFDLPTSAGCTAPVYSLGPASTVTALVSPTGSGCGTILESVTTQFITVSATPTSVGPTQTTAGPETTVTTTSLPTCPFNNGQVFVDATGFSYLVTCDTAYTGTLLNTISIAVVNIEPRLSDCIAACDAYNLQNQASTQCEAVTLDSTASTGNCVLIGGEVTVVNNKPGSYSGIVLRAVNGPGGTTIITGGGSATTTVFQPASTNTITTTSVSISVQPTTIEGSGLGTGLGSGVVTSYVPSTIYQVSTVFSTIVSNGITVIQTIGVSTSISISYIPATASTVTTTERSTITGPTVTTNGGTITQSGPTVTATGPGGSSGGTVTLSIGNGGTTTVSRTTTTTVISYVLPSSASQSSSSSSICRTTVTNYLRAVLPAKRSFFDIDRKLAGEELLPRPGAVPAL